MSDRKSGILNNRLSSHTSLFGLRLLVLIGISVGVAIVIFLFFISLWLNSKHNKNSGKNKKPKSSSVSNISKEIQEIRIDPPKTLQVLRFPEPLLESEAITQTDDQTIVYESKQGIKYGSNRIYAEIGKDKRFLCSERMESRRLKDLMAVPDVSHLDWGHWYALKEIEESTNGFACENVIGEGGYGIVYYGILGDGTQIAVKNLLNNRGQVEKEFKVEVEAIGRVRHKNLVRLLGYCAENDQKMLVYEYLDNGNLEKWLHGDIATISPLTWEIRMNIILGTAKGLAYLHDGLEPKVVHRDIKSSNILLDKQWNPKVSDFGLAKLLGSERSYVTTRVMGTFGYVAPEYASTGMLNERSDVYSFGILIMEIISGRNPVDYSRPPGEVNLVEWLKKMVANQNAEGLLDPKIPEKPSPRALKRVLLVALRCVNPDAKKRPTMGNVVHMLEDSDVQGQEDLRAGCDRIRSNRASPIVGVPMERRISVDKAYYIASPPVNI